MNVHVTRRTTCRLCESSALDVVLPLKPTPIADQFVRGDQLEEPQPLIPLDLVLCRECGHVQLLDIVDPEVLFRDYTYRTSVSLGLVEHFRRFAARMIDEGRVSTGGLVVEIGSNDGSMLNAFQEGGCRVLGIDPAQTIAAQATARGIETWPTFFTRITGEAIRAERGPADLVLANNVFAHADALGDMADGIAYLLSDEGLFVFEVSYLVDLLQGRLFDTIYHEHLSYHSVEPLRTFLRRHGLVLVDVERIPIKGGSIRCFAGKASGPWSPSENVGHLVTLEERQGLRSPEPFNRLSAHLDGLRADLACRLDACAVEGRIVAGYGASATTTTLMYHFELETRLAFLVDDNAGKQGMFSPGKHLPVLASSCLRDGRAHADVVMVLAWQYAMPILDRQAEFLTRGGEMIVPMPTIQVF